MHIFVKPSKMVHIMGWLLRLKLITILFSFDFKNVQNIYFIFFYLFVF